MPTYEYRCQDCGEKLEVVQSIHDDSLTTCPKCGGTLRKLFGNVGVVFKGSGFYKTDSRSEKSTPKKTEKSENSSKDSAGSSGSASDSSAAPAKNDSGSATKADKPAATPAKTSAKAE